MNQGRVIKFYVPPEYPGIGKCIDLFRALCDAALILPGDREPYAVVRKEKPSGGRTNEIKNRKAIRTLRYFDQCLEGIADNIGKSNIA